MKNGAANLLSLKFVFSRNSVDQPLYPRRGSEFSASVQLTPALLAVGRQGLQQPHDERQRRRYKWIEFHKWQFKARMYPGAVPQLEPRADAQRRDGLPG